MCTALTHDYMRTSGIIELVLLAYLSPRIFTDIVLTGFPHTDTLAVPSKRSTNRASAPCVGDCRIL